MHCKVKVKYCQHNCECDIYGSKAKRNNLTTTPSSTIECRLYESSQDLFTKCREFQENCLGKYNEEYLWTIGIEKNVTNPPNFSLKSYTKPMSISPKVSLLLI